MESKRNVKSSVIEILDYRPEHQGAFKALNEEWIRKYFKLEDADRMALDNPKGYILDKGGNIKVATLDSHVVGVCALLKMESEKYDYELAKMGVSPKARGKGIGQLLGESIIEKARQLNASNIYLESNTILTPAITLYKKLGFKEVKGNQTPYERCNIQMELIL